MFTKLAVKVIKIVFITVFAKESILVFLNTRTNLFINLLVTALFVKAFSTVRYFFLPLGVTLFA